VNPSQQPTQRDPETTSPWTEPFRTTYDNQDDPYSSQPPQSPREDSTRSPQNALTDTYNPNR
jgi:hypothetical protein